MVSISLNGRITLHAVLILPIKYDGTADRTSDSSVNGTLGAVNTEKSATHPRISAFAVYLDMD